MKLDSFRPSTYCVEKSDIDDPHVVGAASRSQYAPLSSVVLSLLWAMKLLCMC